MWWWRKRNNRNLVEVVMKVVTVEEKQKKCGGIGGRGKSWKFGVVVEGKPRQESVNLA